MNIGAFFGGAIQFTQTCFERNNHFLVALILEFSTFVAFDNYVEEEISQICSGEDQEEGPGRLSVEQPGSLCFNGGEECLVDCLPNANDSPVCLARQGIGTSMPTQSPASSGPGDSPAPSILVTSNPTPSTSSSEPSSPPAVATQPTQVPTPSAPTTAENPTARPVATQQPSTPGVPSSVPLAPSIPTMPAQNPFLPTNLIRPTARRPPLGSPAPPPSHDPPVNRPPMNTGKGHCPGEDCGESDSKKQSKSSSSGKGQKSEKSSKAAGKGSGNDAYDDDNNYYDDDDNYRGIGNHYAQQSRTVSHQHKEQSDYAFIGYRTPPTIIVEVETVEPKNH
jgi:hypothetical protein